MKISKIFLPIAAAVLAFSGSAIAQDDDHGLITVRTTTVKVGKGPEYRELIGKLAAARKAAGHSGVAFYAVVRGPTSTFYTVTTTDNYAAFDQSYDSGMSDGEWQRWLGRLSNVVDHSVLTTLRTHGELGIPADDGSAPGLLQLRFTVVEPGTGGEHHEWLADTLLPAMREGGQKGYNVSDVRLGDDVNTWISARRLDSWAQLDQPGPFAHMSERARNNMFEDYNDRVVSSRVEIVRFVPELSY
jgi:hypothetical protein